MTFDVTASDLLSLLEQLTCAGGLKPAIYGTIQRATNYFEYHLSADSWQFADNKKRLAALVSSTKAIEQLAFIGTKADGGLLEFPRHGQTHVPIEIEEACYENALALLNGVDINTELNNLNKTSRAYGNVRTTVEADRAHRCYIHGIASQVAWLRLLPWLSEHQSITLVRV